MVECRWSIVEMLDIVEHVGPDLTLYPRHVAGIRSAFNEEKTLFIAAFVVPGVARSSLRSRALDGRVRQAWQPLRETKSASQSHRTGQFPRYFATKPNLVSTPSAK
jgi:hypothetical protein